MNNRLVRRQFRGKRISSEAIGNVLVRNGKTEKEQDPRCVSNADDMGLGY